MSTSLSVLGNALPPATQETIDKIGVIEDRIRQYPQIEFVTEHVFHAGMYARTVRISPGIVFTSVLIKIPTLLIVHGCCDMLAGDEWVRLDGYNILPANSGRKQIYVTRTEVELTMIFPSDVQTVEEAEAQFTDDGDNLLSRTQTDDLVIVTGVAACRE